MQTFTPSLPLIYLNPGAMHFSEAPEKVCTVLGSCISVTLYSPERRIGAICHALLPTAGRGAEDDFRYVDASIRQMVAVFAGLGVGPLHLVAKLFGGSEMIAATVENRRIPSVGRQNIDSALAVLGDEGLTLTALDVGGTCGRKLLFFTHTGDVLARRNSRKPRQSVGWDRTLT